MLPDNGKKVKQEYDYCPTDDEIAGILRYCQRGKVRPHWKLATVLLIGTGRRPSEILALNIKDFPGGAQLDFSKAYVRLAKQNKIVLLYFPAACQEAIMDYLFPPHSRYHRRAVRRLPGGYLFPKKEQTFYEQPYARTEEYGAFWSKLRRALSGQYPGFLERNPVTGIYRIHPHSLRHWFETRAATITENPFFLKELMSYSRIETVMHYVSVKAAREKVPAFMERHYGPIFRVAEGLKQGQKLLSEA